MIIAIFDVEENIINRKNGFDHRSLLLLQSFQKNFPFWIVKTRECLVLKLTREVSISSSAKNTFNHHSLLLLRCFQKPSLSGSSKLGNTWHLNLHERYPFPPQQKKLQP